MSGIMSGKLAAIMSGIMSVSMSGKLSAIMSGKLSVVVFHIISIKTLKPHKTNMIELNTQNHEKNYASNEIDWKNIRKNISFYVEDNVWINVRRNDSDNVWDNVLQDLENHTKLK